MAWFWLLAKTNTGLVVDKYKDKANTEIVGDQLTWLTKALHICLQRQRTTWLFACKKAQIELPLQVASGSWSSMVNFDNVI